VSVGPQLGLLIVLAGVVLALAFMVAGVLRVLAPAKLLGDKVDRLGRPPFLVYVDKAQRKIDEALYAASTLPYLVERARNVILELERAGERTRAAANSLGTAAKALGAFLAK
jgi:hypothetical protein